VLVWCCIFAYETTVTRSSALLPLARPTSATPSMRDSTVPKRLFSSLQRACYAHENSLVDLLGQGLIEC
jgi:hypothetical protein